jgi:hypothetical protein
MGVRGGGRPVDVEYFESHALSSLRTYGSAQATFHHQYKRFATLSELVEAGMLDATFVDGMVEGGYRFNEVRARTTADTFELNAEPVDEKSATRAFNIVEDYVIRFAKGPKAPAATAGTPVGMER